MNIYDIIRKKRDKGVLSRGEIDYWLKGCLEGEIPDYQSSALLMAAFINGLDKQETIALTEAMIASGETMDLSPLPGLKGDKHSTGGVGDKTSLVVIPLAAAAGIKIAKMSGRGLGHTGGTIDKLESIPGFRVDLALDEFYEQVSRCGLAIAAQTKELVPADKLLYALRDVTATVDSIPLIAASIMSKKIASGGDIIVLDVKYGSGAFLKTPEKAQELAAVMVAIAGGLGRKACGVLTSMEAPLGKYVGNALEVMEAAELLKTGQGDPDLRQVCLALAGEMICLAGLAPTRNEGRAVAAELLENGAALTKFKEMVEAQGGDSRIIQEPGRLPQAKYSWDIQALEDGYLERLDGEAMGFISLDLGAGRRKKEEPINYGAGLAIHKKIADPVRKGDLLATLYSDDRSSFAQAQKAFYEALSIGEAKPQRSKLIGGYVTCGGVELV